MLSTNKKRMQVSMANAVYDTLISKSEKTGISKSEIIQMAIIEWFENHDVKIIAEADKYNIVAITDK